METTLEVRWFVKGTPPAVVQNWFKFKCPGELLEEEPEIREDLYLYQKSEDVSKFRFLTPYLNKPEEINLKLRETHLELKLRQQELGTQQFGNCKKSIIWEGNIEQWCKWTEQDLNQQKIFSKFKPISSLNSRVSLTHPFIGDNLWISVRKKRIQRIDLGIKSELSVLKINQKIFLWTLAFEMIKDSKNKKNLDDFIQAVNRASQAYYGPELSVNNSYSYGYWLSQYSPLAEILSFNSNLQEHLKRRVKEKSV